MAAVRTMHHSQVWDWVLVYLLALLLVLAVLTRVAGAAAVAGEPPPEPVASYILSPVSGTFVAGEYRGAEPYVSVGSKVEPGMVVGNVEVWGKLHPVFSTVRGTVDEVMTADDALVETWQPLFKVRLEEEPPPA